MNVSEVCRELEQSLGISISESKVRRWELEGVISADRNKFGTRDFTEQDIQRLKMALLLNEIGISFEDIKSYFENVANPELFAKIFLRTATMKSLINWLEENVGRLTFDKL